MNLENITAFDGVLSHTLVIVFVITGLSSCSTAHCSSDCGLVPGRLLQGLQLPLEPVHVIVVLVVTLPVAAARLREHRPVQPGLGGGRVGGDGGARPRPWDRGRHAGGGGVVAAVGAGEGGVGRGGQRGGGAGHHGDPEGVVVAAPGPGPVPPLLGLLQDVLGVVHGDDARVRDEVRHPPVVLEVVLCK